MSTSSFAASRDAEASLLTASTTRSEAAPRVLGKPPAAATTLSGVDEAGQTGSAEIVEAAPSLGPLDESGTPPSDRRFRPDVEGLRAVAVLLVVLYHAGVPRMTGGFVGVDVFYVISGFVITGLLLRERASRGKTGLAHFYGRRCRRILPAATVVIIATVLASYHWLGYLRGDQVAVDGRTAALFYSNIHFASIGTNYISAQQPPSPLQNYWSLSVEEQFYLVYPTFFLVVAGLARRISLRTRLCAALGGVIVASFTWSILQTSSNATGAYFSTLTRAWELALGALIAVGAPFVARLPRSAAALLSWAGIAAILVATFSFSRSTPYPGYAVALPVLGSAAVIAGGAAAPVLGAEWLLRRRPMQWMGRLSYSPYLWHWPILAIVAQRAGKTPSLAVNLLWVLVALAISVVCYAVIENPLRHSSFLRRNRANSLIFGAILTAFCVGLLTIELHGHP